MTLHKTQLAKNTLKNSAEWFWKETTLFSKYASNVQWQISWEFNSSTQLRKNSKNGKLAKQKLDDTKGKQFKA